MIKEKIIIQLKKILSEMGVEDSEINIDFPPDISRGDYFTNIAFIASKKLNKNPFELAEEIVEKLNSSDLAKDFESIEAVKPGFINFTLSNRSLINQIEEL